MVYEDAKIAISENKMHSGSVNQGESQSREQVHSQADDRICESSAFRWEAQPNLPGSV